MSLRISAAARADIRGAARWYEEQQRGLGAQFISEIDVAMRRIADGPLRYAKVYRTLRRVLVSRSPYTVFYLSEH